MKTIIVGLFCFLPFLALGQYYEVTDLTAENLFSGNIEGPNTNQQDELFVVNYQEDGTIGQVHPNGKVTLYVTLPTGSIANAIVFNRDGDMLLADWKGHQVLQVNSASKTISVYYHDDRFNQPNDICINRMGQLFATDPDWKTATGRLWRIDQKGIAAILVDGLGTTNGIALSPNQKTLYVNESIQRKIWSFKVDRFGKVSKKQLFMSFDDFGLDGMKCDTKGNLFVARYDKGTILMISPKGKVLREISLKGKKVSNLTFGGPDGKTCYVTLQDRKCVETFRVETAGKLTERAKRR